jgi:hypothetical protein
MSSHTEFPAELMRSRFAQEFLRGRSGSKLSKGLSLKLGRNSPEAGLIR